VLRFFIGLGLDPERMSATGYADIIPLVDNDTVDNRARNRRVEFVLEKEKGI
jgi:chemotaxis protein MotB